MKIKKLFAALIAAALTLSISIVPISAEVDNAAVIGNKYLFEAAKRYTVATPGSAILNAYGHLYDPAEETVIGIYTLIKTKPITIDMRSSSGSILFRDTITFEGPDSNYIPGTVYYEDNVIYVATGTFPAGIGGTISVSGTIEHYETKSKDLMAIYNNPMQEMLTGIQISNDSVDVTTYNTITGFVACSTKEVILPLRSALNGTSSDSPKELLKWLAGHPLPAADLDYQYYIDIINKLNKIAYGEDVWEMEYEDADYFDSFFWEEIDYCLTNSVYSGNPACAPLIKQLNTIYDRPENFAYEVVKVQPDGSIVPDPTRKANNDYPNIYALLNDNLASFDGMRVTFNIATDGVATPEYVKDNISFIKQNRVNPTGMYATGTYGSGKGDNKYKYAFNQALFNLYGDDASGNVPLDPGVFYFRNQNVAYNLFTGALVLNSQYSMQLASTSRFGYNATSLVFEYDDIRSNIYTNVNPYLNMLHTVLFATSTPYYWDSVQFEFYNADNAADDLEADDDFTNDEPVVFE
jgi:hypothetical protein